MSGGWIGVDLDGTLARYDGWQGEQHIGDPVPAMADRVRQWLAEGRDVRIFTARVAGDAHWIGPVGIAEPMGKSAARKYIIDWCYKHFGRALPITCTKDRGMVEIWDDRAVQVVPNTGARADGVDVDPLRAALKMIAVLPCVDPVTTCAACIAGSALHPATPVAK